MLFEQITMVSLLLAIYYKISELVNAVIYFANKNMVDL